MSTEIQSLRAEVAALRGEVRRKRRRGRLLPLAIIALFVALIPGLAIAANPFNDLVGGSPHNGNIDLIYNAGITTGCVPNQSYCPTDLVTRQEMASFLARTAGLGGNTPVTNARTLQGFQANMLVRTNVGTTGNNSVSINGGTQVLTSVSLTLPAAGLVLITSGVTVFTPRSNVQLSEVAATVGDRATGAQSTPQLALIGNQPGSTAETSLAPSWVFQATTGGSRTFDLIVQRNPSSVGIAEASSGTLTATYIPFGPGGAQAAEVPDGGAINWRDLTNSTQP